MSPRRRQQLDAKGARGRANAQEAFLKDSRRELSTDPTFAPPGAVAGLVIVASTLLLPGSALACALAPVRNTRLAPLGLLAGFFGERPPWKGGHFAIQSARSGRHRALMTRAGLEPATYGLKGASSHLMPNLVKHRYEMGRTHFADAWWIVEHRREASSGREFGVFCPPEIFFR